MTRRPPNARTIRRAGALVLGALLVSAGTVRAERDYDPRDLVPTALEVYNERASDPLPFLGADQIDDLVRGEVVRVRRRDPRAGEDAPERVTGYVLLERPRLAVWLSALDPSFPENSMLTEVRLEHDDRGGSSWYQHIDLPWPLTDRHWVITLEKDVELARSTEGFVWAHGWRLADDGPRRGCEAVAAGRAGDLTVEDFDEAIYLPANEGAWIMFALDTDLTLLAYRVETIVGGGIPDTWIATFAMAQLTGLLREVDENAATSIQTYDPEAHAAYDGFGEFIPRPSDPE